MAEIEELNLKLKVGSLIRHEKFMDVALRIYTDPSIIGEIHRGLHFHGLWVNLGFTKSFEIGYSEELRIHLNNIGDWQVCTHPNVEDEQFLVRRMSRCYRNGPWIPLSLIQSNA